MIDLANQWKCFEVGGGMANPRDGSVHGYARKLKKNGEMGLRFDFYCNKYSPLLICEICKKQGGKRVICKRYVWKDPSDVMAGAFTALCLGCRNTMTAHNKKWNKADEFRLTINKIKKGINESTKNNARTA